MRGIPAYIVIPSDAPQCKIDAVKTYDGKVILCEPTLDARESNSTRIQQETGAYFVHPYNDTFVMSGQVRTALGTACSQKIIYSMLPVIVVNIASGVVHMFK